MDFDSLINNLLSKGASAEDVAKEFTETLNRITASNKRKEEKERYLDDAREAVYSALEGETPFNFKIAAKAQVIAADAYCEKFSLDQLKELEDTFCQADKWSTDLYLDLNEKVPNLVKSFSEDDKKLMNFLRKAGLSER